MINKVGQFIIILFALFGAYSAFTILTQHEPVSGNAISTKLENSFVKITKITPPITTALEAGSQIEIEAMVNYKAAQSGSISLLAQSEGDVLATAQKDIWPSEDSIILKINITVPNSDTIDIIVPMFGKDSNPTSTVDSRTYEVKK